MRITKFNFQSRDRSQICSIIEDYSGSTQKSLVADPEPMNKSNTIVSARAPEALSMELTELKPTEPLREGRHIRERRKSAYHRRTMLPINAMC